MKEIKVDIQFDNGMRTRVKVMATSNKSAIIKILRNVKLLSGESVVEIRIITPL